jgi:N-acyl-phosphatidylethanolamine-hydrolysing phospholipase D
VSRKYANPPGSPERRAAPADYLSFFAKQTLASFSQPRVPAGHVLPREEALQRFHDHEDADSITWLGHAAFLIRAGGQTVLIDPYLSKIAGPGPFGPARFASSEIGLSDFGKIDAVLLTHNHYDHFDADTLQVLARDASIRVAVPTGLGRSVQRIGYREIAELAWYDTVRVGDLTITATPAIHWSKRGPFDENTSHWCGYLLEWGESRVHFVGDTGYGPIFETMGERFGEIDLGIVGIGAYEPQIIMQPVHTSPQEAVRLCRDMKCRRILGMHWGTIVLSEEDPWEPPVRFQTAAQQEGYAVEDAWIMQLGETRGLRF